jgi:hypothetical protein
VRRRRVDQRKGFLPVGVIRGRFGRHEKGELAAGAGEYRSDGRTVGPLRRCGDVRWR